MSERIVDNPGNHGWVEENGKWVWEGSGGSPAGMTISAVAPPSPVEGQLWFNTGNGLLLAWDGTYWFQVAATAGEPDLPDDLVTSVDGHTGDVILNGTYAPYKHYLEMEIDPTVPDYVKAITHEEIEQWNSGTGGPPPFVEAIGGDISYTANYVIHRFTSSGTFRFPSGSYPRAVEVIVLGGGGAGGAGGGSSSRCGGGGGSGNLVMKSFEVEPNFNYTVTVGLGGSTQYANGGDSSFAGQSITTVTAIGGGAGGNAGYPGEETGKRGGSGGGGSAAAFNDTAGHGETNKTEGYGERGYWGVWNFAGSNKHGGQGGGAGGPGLDSGYLNDNSLLVEYAGTSEVMAGGGKGYNPNVANMTHPAYAGSGGKGTGGNFSASNNSGFDGVVIVYYHKSNSLREAGNE